MHCADYCNEYALSTVPKDVLRRIPASYRDWARLAMTNKGIRSSLGDYHKHRGYKFKCIIEDNQCAGRSTQETWWQCEGHIARWRDCTYPEYVECVRDGWPCMAFMILPRTMPAYHIQHSILLHNYSTGNATPVRLGGCMSVGEGRSLRVLQYNTQSASRLTVFYVGLNIGIFIADMDYTVPYEGISRFKQGNRVVSFSASRYACIRRIYRDELPSITLEWVHPYPW